MPYKFNTSRRQKFPEARYRVTNWPEYDAALVPSGSLTLWLREEAVAAWRAPATGRRGGQPIYSATIIQTGLARRLVFISRCVKPKAYCDPSRPCQSSIFAIPDRTTLSRRGGGLAILPKMVVREGPLHLLVDSTGLKIYGEGEWLDQKRAIRSVRCWPKLHLGVDADTHNIVVAELTPDDIGGVSELPDLLDQVDAGIASLTADGGYEGEVVTHQRARKAD